jgi:hydroxyacylglutathione hydrolase
MMETDGFFETRQVFEDVWLIAGPAHEHMYLVTGKAQAMLVDTGMGIGNLAALVRNLTGLPLLVVNTHGHPDHAGGNPGFSDIWLPPKDYRIMREMCSDLYRISDLKAFNGEGSPEYRRLLEGMISYKPYPIQPLKEGQVFDLGGRRFEVLETPGHTPGSVCLVNCAEKIMFTGDTIVETPVWLYLKHSRPLETYLKSLKKIKSGEDDLGLFFPGHAPTPLEKEALDDLIRCAEEILADPKIGKLTRTFAGEGLKWACGKMSIIYNPENLS